MEAQPMENLASSRSSLRRRNTWTVPLMDVGTGGYGVPQHTTIIWIKSGVSVRVSVGFKMVNVLKQKRKIQTRVLSVPQNESLCG